MNSSIALGKSNYRAGKSFKRFIAKFFLTIAVVACVVTIVVLCTDKTAQAGESLSLNKYYKTVCINYGDTLWNIAEAYNGGSNREVAECVSEIKQINKLKSDSITAGMKLIVPYYSE